MKEMNELEVLIHMLLGGGQMSLPPETMCNYPEGSVEEPEVEPEDKTYYPGDITCWHGQEVGICDDYDSMCNGCPAESFDRYPILEDIETPLDYQIDVPSDTDRDPQSRYYDAGGIETIDIIKAKLTAEEFIGYLKGNSIKYLCRMSFKHEDQVRDSEKIEYYTKWLKEEMTKYA